jgi:hypothetical protein
MTPAFELQNNYQQIAIAVIIAITIGLVTSIFFLVNDKESYSAIYILPNSIIQNSDDNSVFYVYGITSSETQKRDFTLDTYIDDELIKTKQFFLNPGETLEERVKTVIPSDSQYPKKITLILKIGDKSESVHFWIKNPEL